MYKKLAIFRKVFQSENGPFKISNEGQVLLLASMLRCRRFTCSNLLLKILGLAKNPFYYLSPSCLKTHLTCWEVRECSANTLIFSTEAYVKDKSIWSFRYSAYRNLQRFYGNCITNMY